MHATVTSTLHMQKHPNLSSELERISIPEGFFSRNGRRTTVSVFSSTIPKAICPLPAFCKTLNSSRKERIPQFGTAGGDLSLPVVKSEGAALPYRDAWSRCRTAPRPGSMLPPCFCSPPATEVRHTQRKRDGPEERKTDLVLKESEQSTSHDYREPECPPRPAGTHINHFVHHTHVISTTGFMAVAIYVSLLCCRLKLCQQQSLLTESIKLSKQIRLLFCISSWLYSVPQI